MGLQVVAVNEADLPLLRQTYRQHLRSAFINGGGWSLIQRSRGARQ
jgi:hypothetical protein